MGMITELIKYNIKERLRKFRGQERNFDCKAMCDLLNGGEVQERVKHGDMHGYYGHWPRVKFGMNPQEGGFVDGKQVSLEPALRTVFLKAHPNGDVEHKVEFLDTPSGKLAERMYKSKAGGFSSAIDFKRMGDKQIPYGFYGFDFVFEPNYSSNRGHAVALDCAIFDSVDGIVPEFDAVADYNTMISVMNSAYDEQEFERARLERQISELKEALDSALTVNDKLELENIELLGMLEHAGREKPEAALDSVRDLVRVTHQTKFDDADAFKRMELAGLADLDDKDDKKGHEKGSALDGAGSIIDRTIERLTR